MSRRTLILGGAALVLAAGLFVALVDVKVPSRPTGDLSDVARLRERNDLNVVFLVIDTLRADRLSAYGYERPTSPTLTDIASTGIRFAHVESQSSWTKCSMSSLWTGLFPHRVGVTRFNQGLAQEARTAVEVMRENGFVTVGLWRNGWVNPSFGFGQGFDQYFSPPVQENQPGGFERGSEMLTGSDLDLTRAAAEFFRSHRGSRFFLYGHLMDVHQYAYDERAAALGFGSSLSDSYDSAIHWVDSNVNQILAELDGLGLLEKTLVVITSDHGEAFREHGREGHARDLYREVVSVPLILMLPFRLEEPLVVEPLVRNVDIWPTILDLVGLPPMGQTDGVSLVPLIEAGGKANGPVPPSMAFIDQGWGNWEPGAPSVPLYSLTEGDRRVMLLSSSGVYEAYDRATDPGEKTNLGPEKPEWAAPMVEQLDRMSKEKPLFTVPEANVEEMQRQQLKALGYVGS